MLTDPMRSHAIEAALANLPRGSVLIYRAFGEPGALARARALRAATARRGVALLIGADPALARAARADGTHLPQRLAHQAGRLKRAHPGWLVTAAAHDLAAVRRAEQAGADAVLLSAVFPSRSPSAGAPLGVLRFQQMVLKARGPVIALGGVNRSTSRRLRGSGGAGLAAVEAFDP